TLAFEVDGVAASITLRPAVYADAAAMAADVQAQINGAAALVSAGSSIKLSAAGGVLDASSNRYGSASLVKVSGSAAVSLFGAAPVETTGLDVQGSIGGLAASGSGQSLIAAEGGATAGLRISVSGGAIGARGTVTYGQGFAARLNDALAQVIGTRGTIATRTEGLTAQNAAIDKQKVALNLRLAHIEANYRTRFNMLDRLMASLTAQSNNLTQQLSAIKANTPGMNSSQ
ncbi:MAG: flagellar filament capping protein FliD, partial [Betaproteobacteria bacterium]